MKIEDKVIIDKFKPRPYQLPFLDAFDKGIRKMLLIWPRRAGKDLCCWHVLTLAALEKRAVYFYLLPTYSQCKKVLWDGQVMLDGQSVKFLDLLPHSLISSVNSTEMKLTLVNGSIIQLCGSFEHARLMGTNPMGIVMSEYALSDPQALAYLRPILLANGGFLIVNSTPRGHNALFDIYNIAKDSPDWFVSKLTLDDTQHISRHEIQKEINDGEISEDFARQEFFTSFNYGTQGSFYGSIVDKMASDNRIGPVPYEPNFPTFTAWDIGLDTTAIIWFQLIGSVIHIIDYYENTNLSLDHYIGILKNKPYVVETNIFPHDAQNREFTTGISRLDTLKNYGLDVTIAPNISIQDGIEAVRAMLAKCWLDENNCRKLIRCLTNYRQAYDEKRQMYTGKHVHDIFCHGADSARMMAVTLPQLKRGMTAEQLDAIYKSVYEGENANWPAIFRDNLPPY